MTGSRALPPPPTALDELRPACRKDADPGGKSVVPEPDRPKPDAPEIAAKLPRGG